MKKMTFKDKLVNYEKKLILPLDKTSKRDIKGLLAVIEEGIELAKKIQKTYQDELKRREKK